MARVQIHYDDGTTVDALTLDDAVNHVRVQGVRGVKEVREEPDRPGVCKTCGGTGRAKEQQGKRLLTRKQLEAEISG